MRISMMLSGSLAIVVLSTGCGHQAEPPRPLQPAPFSYLSLTVCNGYPDNIVECQLDYGNDFRRQRLGPVQERGLSIGHRGGRYQVESCYPVSRIKQELPNFVCRLSDARSGADAGSVLVKGGTAVRLARILGDKEQLQYRWTPDKWSRLRD